jgi:N-acyl homoserine lactone hydrolase
MQPGPPAVAADGLRVRLVRKGFLVREGARVVEASSTVTLVEAPRKRIIIDTGLLTDCDKLLFDLRSMRIDPEAVDIVINTHLHADHCGCNELFPNALVYAHVLEDPPVGTNRVSGAVTLVPGVEIVPTPGHTLGSMSVFVSAEKRYAICGDAVPQKANYDAHIPPAIAFDRALAMKSMDMIISWAQVIVPGHDGPFEVVGKR